MKARFSPFVLSLLGSLVLPLLSGAHPLDVWYSRFTNASIAPSLFGVAYGGGKFVTVGSGGVVAVSTNGTNWSASFPVGYTLTDITYGGGKFVAVGDKGTLLTSSNAINWEDHSISTNFYLRRVTYANSRFVVFNYTTTPAVTYSLVSTDGITWNNYVLSSNKPIGYLASANGIFVYPLTQGTNLVSTDGVSWSSQSSGTTNNLYMIGAGTNKFVEFDVFSRTFTSGDGTNWLFLGTNNLLRPEALAYGHGYWVAGNRGSVAKYSTDLIHWNSATNSQTTAYAVCFGNGYFVTTYAAACQSAPVIVLEPVAGVPGAFNLFGPIGSTYAIQVLNGLGSSSWQTVTNLPLAISPTYWADPNPGSGVRFYRALLQ